MPPAAPRIEVVPVPVLVDRPPDGAAPLAYRDDVVPLIPHLRAFARSLARGDTHLADDVVQDTLVLALRSWGRFIPGTNLKAWLFTILRNRFHTLVGRRHLTAEVAGGDVERLARVPAEQEGRAELPGFLRAFAALSPSHREVLVLVVVQGFSYERTAEICGCEVGTVKSRISRARASLERTYLGEIDPAAAPVARRREAAQEPGHGENLSAQARLG
jgi:RNA polymerase sigma-70 factor, ECF subfamily